MNTSTGLQKKPKQARSGLTQQKIIRAAARVINEFGLQNATLEKITQESGITTGAIYFHFKNRDALMERLGNEARKLYFRIVEDCLKNNEGQFSNIVSVSRGLGENLSKDPILRSGFAMFVCSNTENHSDLLEETRLLISAEARAEDSIDTPTWDFIVSMIIGEFAICLVKNDFNSLIIRIHQNWQTCVVGLFAEKYSQTHLDQINQVFSENNKEYELNNSLSLNV